MTPWTKDAVDVQYRLGSGAREEALKTVEALETAREALRQCAEALERMETAGRGALDREEFYCLSCGAHHEDCTQIAHTGNCDIAVGLAAAREALK